MWFDIMWTCATKMEFEVKQRLAIDKSNHATSLLKRLNQLREEDFDCNITVKVGDEEVKANRHVLCAGSDYFKAMFSHETKELQTGVVEMKDVDFESVEKCLGYIYTGEISVSEEECEDLLVVACLMQLGVLREEIGRFLASLLNSTVFLTFLKIATKFNCKTLRNACDAYALKNLGAIANEEEFQETEKNYVEFLMRSIIRCPYTQEAKLSVLLKWIKAIPDERECLLLDMMDLLDLRQISNNYIRYLSQNEPLCYESAKLMAKLLELSMDNQNVKSSEAVVPFSGDKNAMIIFDITAKALQAYHPTKNSWKKLCDMHEDLVNSLGYAAAFVDKDLYVFLGTKKVLRNNIMERVPKWHELEDMLFEHGRHIRVTVLGKFIYAAGEQTFERYSIQDNEWEELYSEGVILNQCALVTYDDQIYKIGGCDTETFHVTNEVSKYLETEDIWQSVGTLVYSRRLPAALVYSEGIFAAGGLGEPHVGTSTGRQFEKYNPKTGLWSKVAPNLAYSRSSFVLERICSKYYVIGGAKTIERLDSKENKWVEVNEDVGEIMGPATVAVWLPDQYL